MGEKNDKKLTLSHRLPLYIQRTLYLPKVISNISLLKTRLDVVYSNVEKNIFYQKDLSFWVSVSNLFYWQSIS